MVRVISLYDNFKNKGGAQDVLLVLAKNLNKDMPVVLTWTHKKDICEIYQNENVLFEYISIKTLLKYNSSETIFISHARRLTTLLSIINKILIRKMFIVHVAHNIFTNLKYFTIFPKNIIAVSNAVKKNLIDYFGIKDSNKGIDLILVYHSHLALDKDGYVSADPPNEPFLLSCCWQ